MLVISCIIKEKYLTFIPAYLMWLKISYADLVSILQNKEIDLQDFICRTKDPDPFLLPNPDPQHTGQKIKKMDIKLHTSYIQIDR